MLYTLLIKTNSFAPYSVFSSFEKKARMAFVFNVKVMLIFLDR